MGVSARLSRTVLSISGDGYPILKINAFSSFPGTKKKGLVAKPGPFWVSVNYFKLLVRRPLALVGIFPGHEPEEHFFPALFTTVYAYRRIRVERILR